VLSTHIYRLGILQTEFSLTAAIGLLQSVINFALLLAANYLIKLTGERGIW
jgi:putative aldouronate transport system permease protein